MIEDLAPQEFFQSISIMLNPIDATANRPVLFELADKVFLIWYVIMIQNTKSSIKAS